MTQTRLKSVLVGYGDVGKYTARYFDYLVDIHDPAKGFVVEDFSNYEYSIVCVDTLRGGADDYVNLMSALDELVAKKFTGLAIIRSTVGPNFVEDVLLNRYSKLKIVLFPEFYTAAQMSGGVAKRETNRDISVLGGNGIDTARAYEYLSSVGLIADAHHHSCTMQEAALIKLSANSILATKVAMFNVIKLLADSYGAKYDDIRKVLSWDYRVGANSHSTVPSPDDGLYGFGGACLPKDTLAMAAIEPSGFFENVLRINKYLGR